MIRQGCLNIEWYLRDNIEMKFKYKMLLSSIIFSLYITSAQSRWYDSVILEPSAKLFQQNCSACHGVNAEGTLGQENTNNTGATAPPALNGTAHAWHHSIDVLKNIIKYGGNKVGGSKTSSSMPSFIGKLSDSEIDSVIAYFQSKWPEDIYQKWVSRDSGNTDQSGKLAKSDTDYLASVTSNMTSLLRSRLGYDNVSEPVRTPLEGIYQTQFGKNYAYLTSDGRYLFMGDLIDLEQEQNLTNNAKRKIETPVTNTQTTKIAGILKNRNMTFLLKRSIGSNDVSDPVRTPVDGIYVTKFGSNYAYLSGDGRYVIMGSMIDLELGLNLTSISKRRTAKSLLKQFDTKEKAIFPAIGEEKAVLNIFTDTTCPFCKKLHEELPKLQSAGISIHYLPYPRGGKEGSGYQSLRQVWCAKDRAKALSIGKGLASGDLPAGNCKEGNIVDEGYKLGNKLGMTGTPALFKSNGESIQGYVPYQELIPRVLNN